MKSNWKIFELIVAGLQICLGLIILFFVFVTLWDYYNILWVNPLIDRNSIVEVAIRKNYLLVIVAFISIWSAVLLINNKLKGWILSIITWIMLTILLIISFLKILQGNPSEINTMSIIITTFIIIGFITITVFLNSKLLREKYKPSKFNWLTVGIVVLAFVLAKFLCS